MRDKGASSEFDGKSLRAGEDPIYILQSFTLSKSLPYRVLIGWRRAASELGLQLPLPSPHGPRQHFLSAMVSVLSILSHLIPTCSMLLLVSFLPITDEMDHTSLLSPVAFLPRTLCCLWSPLSLHPAAPETGPQGQNSGPLPQLLQVLVVSSDAWLSSVGILCGPGGGGKKVIGRPFRTRRDQRNRQLATSHRITVQGTESYGEGNKAIGHPEEAPVQPGERMRE